MGKSVIFVVLLIISISLVSAKVIDIPKVKQGKFLPENIQEDSPIGIKRYVYGGNSLVASQDSEGVKYYHQDRLWSNRVITDSSGNKDSEFLSLPFGQVVIEGIDYSFTGKELDSSGLYYFGARYYDSNLGRFSSRDPVPNELPYAYVGNNPMNFIDPDGMDRYSMLAGDKSIVGHYLTPVLPFNYIKDVTGSTTLGALGGIAFMLGHEWGEYTNPAMYNFPGTIQGAGYSFGEYLNSPDTREDLRLGIIGLAVESLNLPVSIETESLFLSGQDNPLAAAPYNERVFFGLESGSIENEGMSLRFGLVAGHNEPVADDALPLSHVYTNRGVGFGFSSLGSHGQIGDAGDFLGLGIRIKKTLFSIDSIGVSFPAYGLFSINQPREGSSYGQLSGGAGIEFNDWGRFPIRMVSSGDSIGLGIGGSF